MSQGISTSTTISHDKRVKEQVMMNDKNNHSMNDNSAFGGDDNVSPLSVYSSYCNFHNHSNYDIIHGQKESVRTTTTSVSKRSKSRKNMNIHCGIWKLNSGTTTTRLKDYGNNDNDSFENDGGQWILSSDDGMYQNIPANVPGDVISDLYKANIISHPYHNTNFLDDAHVWMGNVHTSMNKEYNDTTATTTNSTDSDHLLQLSHSKENSGIHHYLDDSQYSSCHHSRHDTIGTSSSSDNGSHHHHHHHSLKQNYYIPGLKSRKRTWIYQRNFTLPFDDTSLSAYHSMPTTREVDKEDFYVLIIEGIKMGASIEINDTFLGNVTNQFKRYIFPFLPRKKQHLLSNDYDNNRTKYDNDDVVVQNTIRISFYPDIDTNGRFMACSGGWDWAPYTQNAEASCLSRRVWTFGIVKPMYIAKVSYSHPLIVHVVPKIYYLGTEWKERKRNKDVFDRLLEQDRDQERKDELMGDFHLIVDVHLYVPEIRNDDVVVVVDREREILQDGEVIFRAPFMKKDAVVSVQDGQRLNGTTLKVSLSYHVKRSDIDLWWPKRTRMDSELPCLYSLKVAYHNPKIGTMSKWTEKKIGFRNVRLVTDNEFHSETFLNNEGNGFHGMYFRVNNKLIHGRGANVVPVSQLEGLTDDKAYEVLVESAMKANMNLLRVWGGGMILPESFYEACDKNGILVYHDLMFVEEQFHSPIANVEVEDEIRYIVRNLMSHPSIVLWNGCNECERGMHTTNDIYSDFVMKVVAEEDDTRPIWPNSPSKSGWKTGVNRDSGIPNGNELTYWKVDQTNGSSMEEHGPYMHGSSLEKITSVNGHPSSEIPIDVKLPIRLNVSYDIGPQFSNKFISEFGSSVYSSFESMSGTISENNWSLHGGAKDDNCTIIFENLNKCNGTNVMSQRNYPCASIIHAYFGTVNLRRVGKESFQRQLYLCMISQTLWMKGEIEMMRSRNIYGLIIWQLNENWPTGGWGLIEYGARFNEPGQVFGGRWKPLFYLLKQSLFQDVIAACGEGGICFIRNDGIDFIGYIRLEVYNLRNSALTYSEDKIMKLREGSIDFFKVNEQNFDPYLNVIVLQIRNNMKNEVISQNLSLFATPQQLELPDPTILIKAIKVSPDGIIAITLHADKLAFYIVLSCQVEGQFEDNAFFMKANEYKKVYFIPSSLKQSTINLARMKDTLRIQHLQGCLHKTYDSESYKALN